MLFVGGFGRSGSTLFARMLGQMPGFFFAGELEFVWEKHFLHNQPCSCGLPFKECDFWRNVVGEAYGSFDRVDLAGILRLKRSVERIRHIPQLVSPHKTRGYGSKLASYAVQLDRLYAAIREVSSSHTVVDSSKVPRYAYVLANLPNANLGVIHLVRDSRAVAYSWGRRKLSHEVEDGKVYMDRLNPLESSAGWMRDNVLTEPLRFLAPFGYLRIRYEDLIREPSRTLDRVSHSFCESKPEISFINNSHSIELGVSHATEGNVIRFQRGVVDLRPDTEWLGRMRLIDKCLVTAATYPLLLRYGYPLRIPSEASTYQEVSRV